jgi:hypothetical protein
MQRLSFSFAGAIYLPFLIVLCTKQLDALDIVKCNFFSTGTPATAFVFIFKKLCPKASCISRKNKKMVF